MLTLEKRTKIIKLIFELFIPMILIFADQADGLIKKVSHEACAYGAALAKQTGTSATAVVFGSVANDELTSLGKYGIAKVQHVSDESLNHLDAQVYTKVLAEIANTVHATVIIFSNTSTSKAVAPRLSAKLKAGFVAGAIALPETTTGFVVKKTVFSGKAFAYISVNTAIKIITLNPNTFPATETVGIAEIVESNVTVEASKVKVIAINKVIGEVPLAEAELVISGGRGLKGPENWAFVTDFAKLIGAATACSRPVADAGWRPHHEHVGQTGGSVSPNLYFAIGISGAIQHLAGVNRSKVIVVINKDPEAPFFKAADYGIVGDIFEVMPKIIEATKKMKGLS